MNLASDTGLAVAASTAPSDDAGDLHVFGYGSLMWRPGFRFLSREPARLYGLHRSFCIYSIHHRGSLHQPGLVLGLDRGGSCQGFVFRVAAEDAPTTRAYLEAREMVTRVYREEWRKIHPANGAPRRALTYVVDRSHPQYAGPLPRSEILRLIHQGAGQSGPCCDYVRHTLAAIRDLGIRDHALCWLESALVDGE